MTMYVTDIETLTQDGQVGDSRWCHSWRIPLKEEILLFQKTEDNP